MSVTDLMTKENPEMLLHLKTVKHMEFSICWLTYGKKHHFFRCDSISGFSFVSKSVSQSQTFVKYNQSYYIHQFPLYPNHFNPLHPSVASFQTSSSSATKISIIASTKLSEINSNIK